MGGSRGEGSASNRWPFLYDGTMKEAKIKDIRDHPNFKDGMVKDCDVERHPSNIRFGNVKPIVRKPEDKDK